MPDQLDAYMQPGPMVESTHRAVVAFAQRVADDGGSAKQRAIQLYYAARDEIRYDAYSAELSVRGLSASRVLDEGRGYCVAKAVLLAALCRAQGIPARLGFADVRNHLSTERMRQRMKSDVFYWHGYTDIHLDGKWVKATPAFNVELCEKFGLLPLEFNGDEDSIFHPFDASGNQHMEYLHDRGTYPEPPVEAIRQTFMEHYEHWRDGRRSDGGDFDAEVEKETGGR